MSGKRWYRWSLRIVVFAALAWFIMVNLDELRSYDFTISLTSLAASFLLMNLAYLILLFLWIRISGMFGLQAPPLKAGKAWFLSQLGKYVPSKVALLLVRFEVYQGVSRWKITVATGVEYIASLASASLLVLVGLASAREIVPPAIRWGAMGSALVFIVILYPPVLKNLINLGAKIVKKNPMEEIPSYPVLLGLVAAYMFEGLLKGLALFLVLKMLTPLDWAYYLVVTGTFEAAGLIGLAAVFAPGGLGVREGILFLVLSTFMAKPPVIIGAILIRLINTGTEIFLAGFFSLAYRNRLLPGPGASGQEW